MGGSLSSPNNGAVPPDLAPLNLEASGAYNRIFKRPITDDYEYEKKVLGMGFSGPVRVVVHKQTGKRHAVKCYDKRKADTERLAYLRSEVAVYLLLDHPNICKLFAIYEDEAYVWMVMEICEGPELYQRLQTRGMYSEAHAAIVARQMCEAVHYLHSHNVVHRDLKLENWLYEKDSADEASTGLLKLIDFGFSKVWNPHTSQSMRASCGSLSYVSPETLAGEYTNACDMWSMGVTIYFLLCGVPPFFGTSEAVLLSRISRGDYSMTGTRWARISETGKDFVRRLLVVDPSKRMSARDALNHEWIQCCPQESSLLLDMGVLKSMRQFAIASHLKRAALTMMAYCLTTKDIEGLAPMFLKFDYNKDGRIKMQDFMKVMSENFQISNVEVERLFNAMATPSASPSTSPSLNSTAPSGDEDSEYEPKEGEDGEAEICYTDFVAAVLQTRIGFHEEAIREAFLKFDVDRSGYITVGDLRAVLGDTFEGADIEELVAAADTNCDGQIDYNEFVALVLAEVQQTLPTTPHPSPQDAVEITPPPISKYPDNDWSSLKRAFSDLSEAGKRPRLGLRHHKKILKSILSHIDSTLAAQPQCLSSGLIMKSSGLSRSRSSPTLTEPWNTLQTPPSPHARPWDARLIDERVPHFKDFRLEQLRSPLQRRFSTWESIDGLEAKLQVIREGLGSLEEETASMRSGERRVGGGVIRSSGEKRLSDDDADEDEVFAAPVRFRSSAWTNTAAHVDDHQQQQRQHTRSHFDFNWVI